MNRIRRGAVWRFPTHVRSGLMLLLQEEALLSIEGSGLMEWIGLFFLEKKSRYCVLATCSCCDNVSVAVQQEWILIFVMFVGSHELAGRTSYSSHLDNGYHVWTNSVRGLFEQSSETNGPFGGGLDYHQQCPTDACDVRLLTGFDILGCIHANS
jgi:hypothetical protein